VFVRTGPEYVEVRRIVVSASGDLVPVRTSLARITVTTYVVGRAMRSATRVIASHVAESIVMLNEAWTQLEREALRREVER
jgi:hypothetical protein